jgi:mannosyltransferase
MQSRNGTSLGRIRSVVPRTQPYKTSGAKPSGHVGPWSQHQFIALTLVLLVAASLRILGLSDQSLWYDESARVYVASLPLRDLFHILTAMGLQRLPLYFLAVRPFTVPFHEMTVRFPSVLFGLLSIAFVAQAGRKLLNRRIGLIAAILMAVNPFHVWFSRDANLYTLVALSSTGALYFFAGVLRRQGFRPWLGLGLLTGIGLWTHYFTYAIPLVGFLYLLCTFGDNYVLLRRWVVTQLLAFAPLLPWAVSVILQGQFYIASSAVAKPHPMELLHTLWNFSIGYTEKVTPIVLVSLGLFGGTILLAILQFRRHPRSTLLLMLSLCLPIAMTFVIAQRLPMYMDRYLIVTLPAFLILVAGGAMSLPVRMRGLCLAGLIVASSIGTARIYYDEEYYTKEDWQGVASYIESQEQSGDAIMPLLYQSLVPLIGYYYHGKLPMEPILTQDRMRLPATFADSYQRLWYVAPHPHDSSHLLARCQTFDLYADVHEEPVRQWLMEHEVDLAQREDFACISVLLYDLSNDVGQNP